MLLLFSSLNFSDSNESMLLPTRILPVFLSFFISCSSLFYLGTFRNSNKYFSKAVISPFTQFYLIFLIFNSLAGVFNGVSVGWILWKNFELLTGVLWIIVFSIVYHKRIVNNLVEKVSLLLFIFILSISTYEIYFLLKTHSFLNLFLNVRPELMLPRINPIKLSIFAIFITVYSVIKLKDKKLIWWFFIFFGLFLLIVSKSRTGFLILLLYFFYEQFIFSKIFFIRIIIISSIFSISSFFFNSQISDLANIMRIDNLESLSDGSGRISSQDSSEVSSWGESLTLIADNPAFGIGNINTKRFLSNKEKSVDNFILQNFIAGGFFGGVLLSFWAFFKFPFSFWRYFINNKEKYKNFKIRFANLILMIFFVKSLTTNGASFFGFEFLFLGISYTIFDRFKNE